LYFDAVNLFKTNIIDLLDNSEDKKIVLNTYISQLKDIQQKLENTILSLTNNYNEEYNLSQNYLASKQE
jgi:phage shock protein A